MAVIPESSQPKWRLGVVSYLNAKPLIAGLDRDPDVQLVYEVPARLALLLDEGAVDAALVPVIDLVQEERAWRIVSDACIGCDGETLTVRVFSRVAAESITRLHVDGDSHTSVALATIIWRELYGTRHRPVEQAVRDGKTVVMEIDVEGARQVLEQYPDALTIFVVPPNLKEL